MTSDLRPLFEEELDVDLPTNVVARVIDAARARRKRRALLSGSVLATAAVVLGVLVAVNNVRPGAEPRPTDVAAIPETLPRPRGLPNLEAGAIASASVVYIVGGQLIVVDSSTGEAARVIFGWLPDEDGAVVDVAAGVDDVALAPDGTRAVVTVESNQPGARTTVRIVDFASATESVVTDVTPVDDAGDSRVTRDAVYAWGNDSSHFYCACSFKQQVPQILRVSTEGGWRFSDVTPLSASQVSAGTAGVAAQVEPDAGRWLLSPTFEDDDMSIPGSETIALSRGNTPTYIAFRDTGFSIGEVGGDESSSKPLPSTPTEGEYLVVTDAEAAIGGYVAVLAWARPGEGFADASAVITKTEAFFISADGAQQHLTSLPAGAATASFASDLVSP